MVFSCSSSKWRWASGSPRSTARPNAASAPGRSPRNRSSVPRLSAEPPCPVAVSSAIRVLRAVVVAAHCQNDPDVHGATPCKSHVAVGVSTLFGSAKCRLSIDELLELLEKHPEVKASERMAVVRAEIRLRRPHGRTRNSLTSGPPEATFEPTPCLSLTARRYSDRGGDSVPGLPGRHRYSCGVGATGVDARRGPLEESHHGATLTVIGVATHELDSVASLTAVAATLSAGAGRSVATRARAHAAAIGRDARAPGALNDKERYADGPSCSRRRRTRGLACAKAPVRSRHAGLVLS